MPDPFAAALDAIFTAPGSADALYTPAGGTAEQPIRVIRSQPDQDAPFGGGRLTQVTNSIEFRRVEVPDPAEGDRVTIEGEAFEIFGAPQIDVEGMTWTAGIVPA